MPVLLDATRLRFGRFELDRVTGELYQDGNTIRLQEQPRQVLLALLEQPGAIVTREHLRDRLWGSGTFVDYEHGLNTAVKKVRQALGDSADTPQFIETLARRGYRFIGPVEAIGPPAAATLSPPFTPLPAPPVGLLRGRVFAVTVAVLAILASAGVYWTVEGRRVTTASPASSVLTEAKLAVMPLRVLAAPADDASYLGTGLADAITARISNTRQIAVRPTWAVLPFKDQSDPAKVAAALRVEHLLVGTIQPIDGLYRVTVQIVKADGVAIWSRNFDEPRASLLQLQDRLAEQVVAALRVELSAPALARLRTRHTDKPAAYDAYLRGRSLLVNYTEANMLAAIVQFEKALSIDPDFALAHTGIATATAWFSVRYAHQAEAMAWARRADDEAHLALAQDGDLAEAHLAIAAAAGTTYGGFDWKVVLDRAAKALLLDPSLDLAHLARMRAFYHLGEFEKAREEGRLSAAINPTPSVEAMRLDVAIDLFQGHYRAAADTAESMLARTDAPAIRHYLGLARYYLGDVAGARELLGSIARGSEPDARAQAALASVEAAAGMRADARTRVSRVLGGTDIDHHVAFSVGAAYAQLGDIDASLTWLERSADTGFPCYEWFARDTMLDPLRRQPRFLRLMERLRAAVAAQ